jgi:hypothetical protein
MQVLQAYANKKNLFPHWSHPSLLKEMILKQMTEVALEKSPAYQ